MYKKFTLLFVLSICVSNAFSYAQIIPAPQKNIAKGGELRVNKSAGIMLINDDPEDSALTAAEIVNEAFREYWQVPTTLEISAKDALVQLIRITPEQALAYQIPASKNKEAYRLRIETDRITIESTHPQGLFYGANTLAQIIAQSKNKKFTCLEIIEWADYDFRGVSDDISRGQVQLFTHYKRLVRELASYKQNVLMLYVEDAIELHNYSEIGEGRPRLTQKEVRDLVGYAKKYYVEIIPIIETLGHQENILNLKGFQKLAEFRGAMSFCVTEPLVYEYLDKMLKEIAGLFTSPYLHIGGDESFDVGVGRSKALAQQMGLPALHLQHYQKVGEICRKYNKKPMLYGDMLLKNTEILPKLANDFTIMDWQYKPKRTYESTETFEATKLPYWVSPTVWAHTSVFPIINDALANMQYLARAGKEHKATGFVVSNWGDMGHESPKDLLYMLYAFSGACAWNVEKTQAGDVQQQFFKLFFRTSSNLAGTCYAMLSNPALGVTWKEFWQHPLSTPKNTPSWQPPLNYLSKKTAFDWELPLIKQTIDSLRRQVKANADILDSWEITWAILDFYKQKIMMQDRIEAFKNMNNTERNKVVDELLKDLETMPLQIDDLQAKYETFWKKKNKEEGLVPIRWKFDNLAAAFQDTKDVILARQGFDSAIPSKWIYPQTTPEQPQSYAIFKRTLLLTELPITAVMQVMADTYAQIYINGELIDSVYTRNIFSAHLEPKMVKWIDFKNKIGEDENKPVEILIKVHNYNEGLRNLLPKSNISTSAGVNVMIRLQGVDSETLVSSDEAWDYFNNEADMNPKRVSIQPYRHQVITPNFQQNRPSWVER
ncbi:MAG: hypothetical protein EAZ95_13100 [Bacteroidetes bacterium]|nr:MAG: hypothetical protein EAZ95_13100 [Bacteroidota bacterium]